MIQTFSRNISIVPRMVADDTEDRETSFVWHFKMALKSGGQSDDYCGEMTEHFEPVGIHRIPIA